MDFPPGRALLILTLLAVATAIPVAFRKAPAHAGLTIWTFDPLGIDPKVVTDFQDKSGTRVAVETLSTRSLDTRLVSLFMHDPGPNEIPDLVEIEIGSIGKYLRSQPASVGFLPLNADLEQSGLAEQILPARLAPWSVNGTVYGLPLDVHPVSLTYRKDLWDAAGVDLRTGGTWFQFQKAAEDFVQYWKQHGESDCHGILLSTSAADDLSIMLQQRHVNLIDEHGGIHLSDAIVGQTVMFYASLVAGDHAVAIEPSPGEGRWADDLQRGDGAAMFTPDWRISQLKQTAPRLRGKLAMMALPKFQTDDAPTASWGGTMIGLPAAGQHSEQAWPLAVALMTNPPAGQLSAMPASWNDSKYHAPDPFLADNQPIGDFYIQLARALPARIVTRFSALAELELADVLRQAIQLQRDYPQRTADDPDSLAQCMRWLDAAADDLRQRVRLGTF